MAPISLLNKVSQRSPVIRMLSKRASAIRYHSTQQRDANHIREKSIGFIGLGAMGQEMASNLFTKMQSSISSFVIHDTSPSSVKKFVDRHTSVDSQGVEIVKATTPASVSRLASTIITMLPSSAEVEDVYLNAQTGILSGIQDHQQSPCLCIDSTTLDFVCATAVSNRLKEAGAEMLDAPVSGGVVGARDGTLTFMCGGTELAFARAHPILAEMGNKSIYCGKSGSGLAAKLSNNMLLAISMIATSEAMLLGQKLGLKADLLATVINSSTGKCWSSEVNNPAPGALLPTTTTPADRDWQGGFATKLMAKDLRLALQAAESDKSFKNKLPIANLVNEIYQSLASLPKYSNKDFGVIYDWLQNNDQENS